jgi:hypothetical protein
LGLSEGESRHTTPYQSWWMIWFDARQFSSIFPSSGEGVRFMLASSVW